MDDRMITGGDRALVESLHREEAPLPLPFERDLFLIGVEVAGTNHVPNIEALFDALQEGDRVSLFREPKNEYDEYAIRVDAQPSGERAAVLQPVKLGYIPRMYNKMPARLMDAGKLLYGIVRKKEETGGYFHIVIKLYMQD